MPRRALVGETEAGHFELLNELLSGFGFEVVWGRNWNEILRRVSEEKFDLLIADALMAGISGLSLFAVIRKDLANPPKFVVMSAAPEKLEGELGTKASEFGIDSFLRKPVSAGSLDSLITTLFPVEKKGEDKEGLSVLKGRLTTISFPELLMLLYTTRRKGVLSLAQESAIKTIYFEQGQPIYATSNQPAESLGRYLVSRGLIKLKDYQATLEEMLNTGKNQISVLISSKFLSPHQLFEALKELVKLKILRVFAWDHGEFMFREREIDIDRSLYMIQDPISLTREGIRQYWNLRRIRSYLGNRWRMPLIRKTERGLSAIPLSPRELKVWRMLDDKTSIDLLLDLVDMPKEEIAQIAFFFVATGQVAFGEEMIIIEPKALFEGEVSDELRAQVEAYVKKVNQLFSVLDRLNYFQLLGVSDESSLQDIQKAYIRATKDFHNYELYTLVDEVTRAKADAIFRALTEAYETLTSKDLRASYISELEREEIVLEARKFSQRAEASAPKKLMEVFEEKAQEEVKEVSLESMKVSQVSDSLLKSELKYQEAKELINSGQYSKAVEILREVIELNPKEAEYHAVFALTLFMSNPNDPELLKEALSHINEALKLNPSSEEAYFARGKISLARGQRGEAIKCFQVALRFNPQHEKSKEELKQLGFKFN